jgi:hypothetical protein
MSQRARRIRVIAAWILLVGSLVGWPVSMLTFARDEPPAVLSLSWIALIISSAELLTTSQVHQEQGENSN